MNPHAARAISPLSLVLSVTVHRRLIYSLIKREVLSRYRGSAMGLLWSFINPLLMLAVYTFVFSVVFKARWAGGIGSRTEFSLVLFASLMVFNFFSECVNRAPGVILANVNYVKKVIFPLEVLPIVVLGSAAFHFLISLLMWVMFYTVIFGPPPLTALQLPLVLLPLVSMTLGLSWFLASFGVYLRDVGQFIGLSTAVLLFLSPVFYPIAALPEEYRILMQVSPMTFIVEQTRDVLIWGRSVDWMAWACWMTGSMLIAWSGYAWFQKTRKGFADVL